MSEEYEVRYFDWLSSRGGRYAVKREGAVYAGEIADVPTYLKSHINRSVSCRYCIIWPPDQKGIEDGLLTLS